MKALFFASNLFEVLQAQNLLSQFNFLPDESGLVLWCDNQESFDELSKEVETTMFSVLECYIKPIWPYPSKTREKLSRAYDELETLIHKYTPEEIFIPDPEKGFNLCFSICQKNKIKISLYEADLSLYRFLDNHKTISEILKRRYEIFKALIVPIKTFFSNNRKKMSFFSYYFHYVSYTFLYQLYPGLGWLFLKPHLRCILKRIVSFHRIFVTNPDVAQQIYQFQEISKISLNNLISNRQKIKIYSTVELWSVDPNHLIFLDQNYLDFGVSPKQHVNIILTCLQTMGRTHNVLLKLHDDTSACVENFYRSEIVKRNLDMNILNSNVLSESLVSVRKIRRVSSLAGSSYIYISLINPEVRSFCFHRLYEDTAKEIGVKQNVIQKIQQYHGLFQAVSAYLYEDEYKTSSDYLGFEKGFFLY